MNAGFRWASLGLALFAAFGSGALPAFAAAPGGASAWSLQAVNTGRTCNLKLKYDAAGGAGGLAIPAGCRQAIPALRKAAQWSIGSDAQILFTTDDRQNVLTFARQADGTWQSTAVDGTALMLTASPQEDAAGTATPSVDDTAVAHKPGAAQTTKATPEPTGPPVSPQDLVGRYAVMRGDRDTGCMVTLDKDRGRDGPRARLAPACRDQGIIIFDPVNWRTKGSELILTARKGHSIALDKDENGVWAKKPKDAKALGLKPL